MAKKNFDDLFDIGDFEKKLKKIGVGDDFDLDGIADMSDCAPLNPLKHAAKEKDWFTGKKLGSVGYDVDDSTSRRRSALRKMIRALQKKGMTKSEAAMKTWQKLHGIYVTWKNQPGYSQDDITAVRRDRNWVSKNYKMNR